MFIGRVHIQQHFTAIIANPTLQQQHQQQQQHIIAEQLQITTTISLRNIDADCEKPIAT
jgi:hypothetical protein